MSSYCRVESFTFLSTGVKFSTIDWLVLIDNCWTLIDGLSTTDTEFFTSPRMTRSNPGIKYFLLVASEESRSLALIVGGLS